MALHGLGPFATVTTAAAVDDDPSKKIRKPYTITKSRESWTEPEHDKFLEALQLFDRDWKKIEAFIGSKTVIQASLLLRLSDPASLSFVIGDIQIRSHAQKYFLKVQKSGAGEHLPPPRPKRKATHPYPQKASKNVPVLSQMSGSVQSSSAALEPRLIIQPDSSSMLMGPISGAATNNSIQIVSFSGHAKGPTVANNCCSSTESTPTARDPAETTDQGTASHPLRVLPDFAQVYNFIGSVFDPNVTGHLQQMKKMDPIDVETVLLLMRNLSINLTSPDFEDHRRLLSSYEVDTGSGDGGGADKAPT